MSLDATSRWGLITYRRLQRAQGLSQFNKKSGIHWVFAWRKAIWSSTVSPKKSHFFARSNHKCQEISSLNVLDKKVDLGMQDRKEGAMNTPVGDY